MGYLFNCLPRPDSGTLVIDLNDGHDFSCIVWASGLAVSTVAGHGCLPTSVRVAVAEFAKFRTHTATRTNEYMPTMFEGVSVCKAPRVSWRAVALVEGERRPLQRGGSSALNQTLTEKPYALMFFSVEYTRP